MARGEGVWGEGGRGRREEESTGCGELGLCFDFTKRYVLRTKEEEKVFEVQSSSHVKTSTAVLGRGK